MNSNAFFASDSVICRVGSAWTPSVGVHYQPKFEVVACIAGRGFGVRQKDMEKLHLSTRGKVFTLQTMREFVGHTRLAEFRSR
ncbi:MAG: hypothetical protein OXS33_03330 [bacterium]|nr:hypothetical protein [bacterium]